MSESSSIQSPTPLIQLLSTLLFSPNSNTRSPSLFATSFMSLATSHAVQPFLLYTPNDAVSLTVAESESNFDRLSRNKPREAIESHPLVPKLSISDTTTSILALQVTLFPGQEFVIGLSTHHSILDGKNTTLFIKAWDFICKNDDPPSLPADLIPVFDRTVIQDPGLLVMFLVQWANILLVILLIAKRISEIIKGMERGVLEEIKEAPGKFLAIEPGTMAVAVAGSPRFKVYRADFGWGRPKKVAITSVHKTGAISLAESSDGSGGVEVGLALREEEMEIKPNVSLGPFATVFYKYL